MISVNSRKRLWTGVIASFSLLVLIFDSNTALTAAQEGIELCLKTVVPSLFPFFILSSYIRNAFMGKPIKILRPLGKICAVPEGAESLLLLGILGGYPVGALGINDAYENGALSKKDARRMLGFCNNAGPAFIFGMISILFSSTLTLWILWGIHIVSALVVGIILAPKNAGHCNLKHPSSEPFTQIIEKSIKTTAYICAWVIIFRVIITFSQRWFLWLLPVQLQTALVSFLELLNGCYELRGISNQGMRFILCSVTLAFGGICVAMQTLSVTKSTGTGMYFPGKILQTVISFFLATATQIFLFSPDERCSMPAVVYILAISVGVLSLFPVHRSKKTVAIPC